MLPEVYYTAGVVFAVFEGTAQGHRQAPARGSCQKGQLHTRLKYVLIARQCIGLPVFVSTMGKGIYLQCVLIPLL